MTRYINYSGQIKSEKELKKLIKETIQLTNHKELTIFKNILEEEKQRSSSFEFEDAFAQIGIRDIDDKEAQGEIVKKNNITLFVLFHMFDDTFTNKWKEFYDSAKLNAENQEEYRQRNKGDVQDKLKIWVKSIKDAKDVDAFNKATKDLKTGINNLFFYWEPLLIIGKNIDKFNTQIRDTLFNTLKDSKDWAIAAGKITHPSEKGDGKIKELLRSTDFFEKNPLTTEEKQEIWKEKAESGLGSWFGGSGSDDSEGIWSWIKGLLNSAAAFFLGDDYKNVADDLFKGLGKFENMLNNNPKDAQDLMKSLLNLGDQKADKKISTQQQIKGAIDIISTGNASEVVQNFATNAEQLSAQKNEQKEDATLETATLKPFDSSIFENAIQKVKDKWLDNTNNTDFTFKESKIIRADWNWKKNYETKEENCGIIKKNIRLINLDLYIIYTILSDTKFVEKIDWKNMKTKNEQQKSILNTISSFMTKNSTTFSKLYDELYGTSTKGAVAHEEVKNVLRVDILTFCNNLVELYNATIQTIKESHELNGFRKYLNDIDKKEKLIKSIEELKEYYVWKNSYDANNREGQAVVTLFSPDEEKKATDDKIERIYFNITLCISNWDDISDKIKENFGEWLSEQK